MKKYVEFTIEKRLIMFAIGYDRHEHSAILCFGPIYLIISFKGTLCD